MLRYFSSFIVILLAIILVGCGATGKSIVAKQAWSENYAKAKGVEATSPLMIDGDPSTLAETATPIDTSATATKFTEAIVKFPEAKKIKKIVVQSTNLRSFIVYAGGNSPDDWKTLKEFKNIEDSKVSMNVSTTTDRIKIRVLRTSDDTTIPGGRGSLARLRRAPAKIKEIEVYGFIEDAEAHAVTLTPTSSTIATTTGTPAVSTPTATPAPEIPKGPPISVNLETTQKDYALAGPIPIKVNIKAGADEIIVIEDILSDKMISTKFNIKSSSGESIACSMPTPPLSSPRPYRSADRAIDVRNAKTIDPGGSLSIDIVNLLDYYPIKVPGTYTIQLSMFLDLYNKFVGREATEKDDLERQIRDINSKSNYTAQEKATLIQSLKGEIQQSAKKKSKRYIDVSSKGTPFKLESNTIQIVVQ